MKMTAFHKLQFLLVGVAALVAVLLLALSPLAGTVLTIGQLVLFAVAGARVADLLHGDVGSLPEFLAAVGGLLVAVALLGGWFPALGYPAFYLELLQAVGVALLVLPLALPFRVRSRFGEGC